MMIQLQCPNKSRHGNHLICSVSEFNTSCFVSAHISLVLTTSSVSCDWQLGYDPSEELLGLGVDLKPRFMLLFLNSFISFISSKCELILAFGTSLL